MPLVLGVDSSTQSTTVELRDSDNGQSFASGRVAHPPLVGRYQQDPQDWWQGLVDARHEAGGALGVSVVATAAQSHCLVVLDHDGRVLRPAKLWGDDAGAPDALALVDALGGPKAWVQACGSVPSSSFAIAKLAWIRRREPDVFARIAHVLLAPDWMTLRLSRRAVCDAGSASGTGYFSSSEPRWRPDLLQIVDDRKDWESCLPLVAAPHEPAGDREGVMIAAGTGDSMAAALGLGLRPRDVVVSLEPRTCVFTVRDRPTEDPTGRVSGLADATGRFLPRVDTPDLTGVLDGVARLLGLDRSRFDKLALDAMPGAGGLVLVPGGGPDGAATSAAGVLAGITSDVSADQLARAAVEGMVCTLLDGIGALREADVPVSGRMFLVGGGAGTHAIQRVLADLSGRVVGVPKGDPVATGACVHAAATLHGAAPEQVVEAWGLDRVREIEPDGRVDAEAIRAGYRAARDRGRERRDEGPEAVPDPYRDAIRDQPV